MNEGFSPEGVVECDISRYQNKNLDSLVWSTSVEGYFFTPSLKHCTARSARPLLDG